MASPTPSDIIGLALSSGFKERRPEISYTLFFEEISSQHDMPPVLINIYYTTRSIMTYMNHPSAGSNELWRSNAYKNIEDLQIFFKNPRSHTGKGYRKKENATRGCVQCGVFKKRNDFSKNQWSLGPDLNRCKQCVTSKKIMGSFMQPSSIDSVTDLASSLDSMNLLDGESYPTLTSDLLSQHNQSTQNGSHSKNVRNHHQLERRQFNCPECPNHGRGKNVFFKKVPRFKPICKCPLCKKVTRGDCKRLCPVPKSKEKGYGHFKCHVCHSTWGSSRALANIGQQCFVCLEKGPIETFVKPFRLEVVKIKPGGPNRSKGGILGGQKKMRRKIADAPIMEEEEAIAKYTQDDQRRNEHSGNEALIKSSFRYEEDQRQQRKITQEDEVSDITSDSVEAVRSYVHKCEGCAKGLCRNRYLPISATHDESDGDTVSTSASIITNSSIDKAEYQDRDAGFDDFVDEDADNRIGLKIIKV